MENMKFTIETKVGKNEKPYSALFLNGQMLGFVNKKTIEFACAMTGIKLDEVSLEKFELQIKL